MEGVLINGKLFIPFSAILEIDLEEKWVITKCREDAVFFRTCKVCTLAASASLNNFHLWTSDDTE